MKVYVIDDGYKGIQHVSLSRKKAIAFTKQYIKDSDYTLVRNDDSTFTVRDQYGGINRIHIDKFKAE